MPRRLSFTRLSLVQQPLLFPALAFIAGLLGAARYGFAVRTWLTMLAAVWLVSSFFLLRQHNNWLITALLLSGCFAGGGALWALNEASVGADRVRVMFERGELSSEEPLEIYGTLDAAPELAPDRIYLSLAVTKVTQFQRERTARGAVQIVVRFYEYQDRVDYDALALAYGSRVRVLGQLSNRRGYRNPGAPDFDEMLEHRGYDASGRVKSPLLIERLGAGERNRVLVRLYAWRARALAVLLRGVKQPAAGVLAASLLGARHFLSYDTAESFRAGGTFHLLVISGLHVALIAGALLWLTRWLSETRVLRYVLVSVCLWGYALMVGAQPAITRAAVMLTIGLFGQMIFRTALGANTLAASALVLLAWQPRDLFNPGFQLSFLTVLLIVVLTAPIYTRLKSIGEWRPTASTPYPPRVPQWLRRLAELLFWNEREFRKEMAQEQLRYRVEKTRVARWLSWRRLQQGAAWTALTIFTTTAVQLGLLPLMIKHFHRVSLVSPLTNVLEGALVFALMIAGAAYWLLHAISAWLAAQLAVVINALGRFTVWAGEYALRWPRASFRVPDWGAGESTVFAAYFALLLVLIVLLNEWHPLRKGDDEQAERRKLLGRVLGGGAVIGLLILSGLLSLRPFAHEYARGRLSVTFLDVGQGDAMVISFPRGQTMLLDSGGQLLRRTDSAQRESGEFEEVFVEDRVGIGEAAVLPYLWRRGIARLDFIAATHGDADHAEGFGEIVRNVAVGQALTSNAAPDFFTQAVQARGLPLQQVQRGEELNLDGVRVQVLSPFAERFVGDNNNSLVLRLTFGSRSFLLTGDIERQAEARLLEVGAELRADVLKVAHHGSRTSSTAEFLARVAPQHAVISVGSPSPFGHPHAEVLARLRETGARIWQTSQCGALTISTDGADLRVETFVKCE